MSPRHVAPLALLLLAVPTAAEAGPWYYRWICTGLCAPGPYQGTDGREGPFATYEDCDYARTRDRRDTGPRPYTLMFCEDANPGARPSPGVPSPAPQAASQPVRTSQMEMGLLVGPAWSARSDTGTTTGAFTFGFELDQHTGRDVGGGTVELGLQATRLEAPLLGAKARTWFVMPFAVGLALTPQVWESGGTSVRLDLSAVAAGLFQFGCSGCAGSAFQETLAFGYAFKAGVDLYLDREGGVSLDVVLPRYTMGNAAPNDVELASPKWMLRLSLLTKPDP